VAVLHAARTGVPPAAGSAFGVLVAGTVSGPLRWTATILLAAGAGAATVLAGGSVGRAGWAVAAVATGLLAAALLGRAAARRLGGVSGDVFGALVEVATTASLVVLAAETAWR
jgi:adenosylcobinamide-GDP ribazoletransferase